MSVAAAQPPRPAGLPALVRSLLINLLGPYLVYLAAAPHFRPDSPAPLLLCAVVPAAEFAIVFARKRNIDAIAIVSFVQISAGLAISLFATSARASLGGHAMMPAVLGTVFALSAVLRRPLIASLARQTMAGDDPQRRARFDAIAPRPAARRIFMRLTLAWAGVLGVQSLTQLVALRLLNTANYLLVAPALGYGILALLIWGSIHFGRRAIRNDPSWATPT